MREVLIKEWKSFIHSNKTYSLIHSVRIIHSLSFSLFLSLLLTFHGRKQKKKKNPKNLSALYKTSNKIKNVVHPSLARI